MKLKLIFGLAFCLSLALNAQISKAPYELKFSEPTLYKGSEQSFSQDIIGTNETSVFVLFTEKRHGNYYNKPDWIIRKFNKQTLELEKEASLKDIFKEVNLDKVFNVSMFNEGLVVILGSGSKSSYTFKGLVFNKHLDLLSTNDQLLTTNGKDNIVDLKVNNARKEVLIIEYPECDISSPEVGTIYRFNENLDARGRTKLDLNFLLEEKRNRSNYNLRNFLRESEFTSNNNLVNITKVINRNSSFFSSSNTSEYILYALNLENEERFIKNIELDPGIKISGISMFLNDEFVSLSGFFIESVEKEGLIFKYNVNQIKGTFLFKYDLKERTLVNRQIIPFEEKFQKQIVDNHAFIGKEKKAKKKADSMAEDEGVNALYKVKEVYYNSDASKAYFVCEYYNNYEVTYTTTNAQGQTTTHTTYYAQRGSMFTFEMSLSSGKINWMNNYKKYSSYSSGSSSIWNTVTLVPVKMGEEIKLLFSSHYTFEPGQLTGNYRGMGSLEYPFYSQSINLKDGSSNVFEPQTAATTKSTFESFNLNRIYIDSRTGDMFSMNSAYRKKPLRVALMTVGYCSIIGAYPTYIYWMFSQKRARNEEFNLARASYY